MDRRIDCIPHLFFFCVFLYFFFFSFLFHFSVNSYFDIILRINSFFLSFLIGTLEGYFGFPSIMGTVHNIGIHYVVILLFNSNFLFCSCISFESSPLICRNALYIANPIELCSMLYIGMPRLYLLGSVKCEQSLFGHAGRSSPDFLAASII